MTSKFIKYFYKISGTADIFILTLHYIVFCYSLWKTLYPIRNCISFLDRVSFFQVLNFFLHFWLDFFVQIFALFQASTRAIFQGFKISSIERWIF